jgi:outer membrane protein assembly factor BamB
VALRRQLTVYLNRVVRDDLIRGNARRATPGTVIAVGGTIVVGDHDWGVAPAEVVEYDQSTGTLVLRVPAELELEAPS